MGWLVSDRPLTHESPAAYFTREYSQEHNDYRSEVLAAAQVGGAVYMAVRHTHKQGEHAGRCYTYAAVILVFNNAKEGFGRKSMDESSGPCEVNCPAKIMALLSPVEEIPNSGYAADWRARVAAAVAARRATASACRLRPGQQIRLPHPVSFNRGRITADTFVVVPTPARRRGPVFRPLGHDLLCRLPAALIAVAVPAENLDPVPGR